MLLAQLQINIIALQLLMDKHLQQKRSPKKWSFYFSKIR
jgi:hypothetical protein